MSKLLVVEDNPVNVTLLTRLLVQREKFEAVFADNRRDAVRMAAEEQPDLIIMDIGLPDEPGGEINISGGLEAVREIRAQASTQKIPVIALTAQDMDGDRARIMAAGCNGYVRKPWKHNDLVQSVRDHLASG